MGDAAIVATRVGKRFVTYKQRPTSLKERLVQRRAAAGELWALRDVSAEIGRGHTVGLVGPNGSGKSTLLKVLAGILQPTTGAVGINGRIASLLELGAGFNGELSGRDNVYLNASLLGLNRREVDRLFDEIVEFSELADFIDTPVKHYSSGMYVRLGFAVAVHVDPDILLVDEVLAVGDEAFQQKCLRRIDEFQREGRTILFVSHALDLVERLCDRTLVLHHGRLMHDGDPTQGSKVLRGLLGTVGDTAPAGEVPDADVRLTGLLLTDRPGGEPRESFRRGEPFTVTVGIEAGAVPAGQNADVSAVVMGPYDIPIFSMSTAGRGGVPLTSGHELAVTFCVEELPPILGGFVVAVGVKDSVTGAPLAARRFDQVFTLQGDHTHGLVDVPYVVRTDGRPPA